MSWKTEERPAADGWYPVLIDGRPDAARWDAGEGEWNRANVSAFANQNCGVDALRACEEAYDLAHRLGDVS